MRSNAALDSLTPVIEATIPANIMQPEADRINLEKVQMLADGLRLLVIATMATASIVLIIFFSDMSAIFKWSWYPLFLLLTYVRLRHLKQYANNLVTTKNIHRAIREFTLLSFFSGALWGCVGFHLITADDLVNSVIILMILTGVVATATAASTYFMPSYLAFILPILLPMAYRFYTFDEPRFYWITAFVIFYIMICISASRGIRSYIHQSIEYRFQNLDLIDTMRIEQLSTEEALQKANRNSMAKSRFFAAASHDLRQPLQSLSLFTATLDSQIDDKEQTKIVSQIKHSVESLEGLFNGLLDISSLDAGTQKVNKQHLLLNQQLFQLNLETAQIAKANNLIYESDIGDHVVFSDPMLLDRILRNLVTNAINYTDQGSVKLNCTETDDHICISVSDTGKGISRENQARIFEEFVQLHNPERDRSSGLGLGLSIVKRLCDLLDYKLTLSSEVGVGSEFSIWFDKGDRNKIERRILGHKTTDPNLDGKFILVIDDEELIRLSMEGLLVTWGCTVMVASSGEEAVSQLIEFDQQPDIVLSDFRLRNNETGGDAIQSVRNHCTNEVPAILITGDIAPERLLEIDSLKMPVLHKPCDPIKLKQLMHELAV